MSGAIKRPYASQKVPPKFVQTMQEIRPTLVEVERKNRALGQAVGSALDERDLTVLSLFFGFGSTNEFKAFMAQQDSKQSQKKASEAAWLEQLRGESRAAGGL